MIKIAVIISCFNRCAKTVKSLESLYRAEECFNKESPDNISSYLFLTDDGSTDGTAATIKNLFSDSHFITIIQGNGQLYWAGGMRCAWNRALNSGISFDFYLLMNDDTILYPNAFHLLLELDEYAQTRLKRPGLYSGICRSSTNSLETTYGGDIWINSLFASRRRLPPIGVPQNADMVNANILLIANCVVEVLGVFYDGYHHGHADYDYSIKAKRYGFPVLLTSEFCGICDNDHLIQSDLEEKICSMTLKERIQYYKNPLHSNADYLLFIKRNAPSRLLFVLLGRFLNVFFPRLYYHRYK